jgi:hypothetical protein
MQPTNVQQIAYSKMSRIVEEGKASAARGIEALQKEWSIRQDYVVKPTAIVPEVIEPESAETRAKLAPYLVMRIGGAPLGLTSHARGQLLERAGVPSRFADNLLSWGQGDLLVSNMTRLLPIVSPEAILVREVGGVVKANLSASYKRMDASPIFESFTESALRFGLVPYKGEVSDTRAYLSFLKPEVKEIAPGEHVVFGVELRSSDYGNGALEVNQIVVRLLCTNGMIGSDMLRKVHLGRRFDSSAFGEESTIKLSQRTVELDTAALRSGVRDVVRALPQHMTSLEELLKARASAEVSLPQAIAGLTKRGLGKETTEKVKALYEQSGLPVEAVPSNPGAWRLSNVLSMLANGEPDADKAHDLNAAAWDIMLPEQSKRRAARA